MDEEKAKKLNRMTKRLFNQIEAKDVLTWSPKHKTFFIKGHVISPEQTQQFIEDALLIKNTGLWKHLMNAMKHEANLRMYQNSLSFDDMVAGKWALWTLDIIEQKVENIAKLGN